MQQQKLTNCVGLSAVKEAVCCPALLHSPRECVSVPNSAGLPLHVHTVLGTVACSQNRVLASE